VIGSGSSIDFGGVNIGHRVNGETASEAGQVEAPKEADQAPKGVALPGVLAIFRTISITEDFTQTQEVEIYAQAALDRYMKDLLPKDAESEGK
jgi:hypothetical protein